MHEQDRKQVGPRLAATAVILRDGAEGIEAFMVVRHRAIEFASGALVFPGGKVDAQDTDPAWAELAPARFPAEQRALRVAAAREAFEEAGLVLARRRGSPTLLTAEDALRLERYRSPLIRGETTFFALLRSEGLALASELMIPFAHWITPEGLPKRFDTHFFLVAAPVGQLGAHDGSESVDGLWIAPRQALKDAAAGRRTLVFATELNLKKLARHATVAEAVAATAATPIVTVMPKVIGRTATTRTLQIPAAAGYGVSEVVVAARVPEPDRG